MTAETLTMTNERPAATGDPLLRIEALHKAFGGQIVLDEISADIRPGEVILLRGKNGSGKTTLLNILSGALPADRGAITFWESRKRVEFPLSPMSFLGTNFSPENFARSGLGRTWQDVRLFLSHVVWANLAVARRGQRGERPLALLSPWETAWIRNEQAAIKSESFERLAAIGLADRAEAPADAVSLGQAKRISILRAIEGGARFILLDEPLAGLDERGIDDVLSLLRRLAFERRVTLLIVEHTFLAARVLSFATRVWTLADGQLTDEPASSHRAAVPAEPPEISPLIARAASEYEVSTREVGRGARLHILRRPGTASGGEPILRVRDAVIYRGKRLVVGNHDALGGVSGLELDVYAGEIAVLQAANGWGKTTLFDALAGLVPIERGDVVVDGRSMIATPAWRRARSGIGYLRARDNYFATLSVAETLRLCGAREEAHLQPFFRKAMGTLSGGERQRVILTATDSVASRVLLLDEPFSSLDDDGSERAWWAIRNGASRATVIAIPLNN